MFLLKLQRLMIFTLFLYNGFWLHRWKLLSHVRLFAIPWTVAYQTLLSTEFSRPEYWSGLQFPSPGDLPNPEIKSRSPALEADSFFFFFGGGFLTNWSIWSVITINLDKSRNVLNYTRSEDKSIFKSGIIKISFQSDSFLLLFG